MGCPCRFCKKEKSKEKRTIKEILKSLKDGKYEIRFSWIGKKTYADIDNEKKKGKKKLIRINIILIVAEKFIHEFLHDSLDLEKFSVETANAIVETETKKLIEAFSIKEIKKIAKMVKKNSNGRGN